MPYKSRQRSWPLWSLWVVTERIRFLQQHFPLWAAAPHLLYRPFFFRPLRQLVNSMNKVYIDPLLPLQAQSCITGHDKGSMKYPFMFYWPRLTTGCVDSAWDEEPSRKAYKNLKVQSAVQTSCRKSAWREVKHHICIWAPPLQWWKAKFPFKLNPVPS